MTPDEPLVVYQLVPKVDGTIQFTLSLTHLQFLVYLANERNGECPYDYGLLKPETATHMKLLIAMRLMSETSIVGTGRVLLRLTDMGRNIVGQIEAQYK